MKERERQWLTAAGLLAALLLPAAAALLLVAHELLEHRHRYTEETCTGDPWHSPSVRGVLEHGHDHEAGAPAHEHEAVRRSDRGSSSAPDRPSAPAITGRPFQGATAPDRSGRAAAPPPAAARGAPQTLGLLCVLRI